MAKQIRYEKMHKSEKAYRITMIVTYILAAITVLSCIFTVPNMGTAKDSVLLVGYGAAYAAYLIQLIVCAVLAVLFFKKTRKEYAAVQAIMLFAAAAFTGASVRMFAAMTLYGVGMDSTAEKLFGTDMDALTSSFTTGWVMLAIAFVITMITGMLSIVRMALKKYS